MKSYDVVARRQLGLVTTAQLASLGYGHRAQQHAVAAERLIPVRRGVLRTAGAAMTHEQSWLAAVLTAAAGAVLSHGSAAYLWAFLGFPPPEVIHISVESWSQPRLVGVRGHRTASLPAHHCTIYRSIPVTTAERTLIDACGLVSLRQLGLATDEALRQKVLSLPRLARTADEVPTSGRRKIRPALAVLRERVPGFDAGGSEPELDLVRLLTKAGFPRPDQQIRVTAEGRTHRIDVGWRSIRVGFEYDSVSHHNSVSALHEDRARLRRLKRAGWDVWPVTSQTTRNEILAIAALAFERSAAA